MIWAPPLLVGLELASGATIGSFVTTSAIRASKHEKWSSGRSRCDACGASLRYYQTVPVVSYMATRGRCKDCGARINWLHPAGEVAGAIVVVGALGAPLTWSTSLGLILSFSVLYAAIFDFLTLIIPGRANRLVFGLCGAEAILAHRLVESVLAALVVYLGLRLLKHYFARRTGREGIGGGDVKLLASLALGAGAEAFPYGLVSSAALALLWVWGARILRWPLPERLPFGPFIALGWGLTFVGIHLT